MAVNGEVPLKWGDGEHTFNVAKLRCVLELEEKCNCGFAQIYQRLAEGKWYFNDIRETIRLGLIGGGKDPDRAMTLVNRYVDERPFAENVLVAQAIIFGALVGVKGDNFEKKEKTGQTAAERSTETVDSSAPSSTDSEQQSASAPAN